ncbi:hypothetical protein RND71_022055 [Anisodus tanguticus]|uniref:PHD-type domain-containing protein n=1 Tax=Anisodus tanguticus TaxID=243964 RepID=A0AAE1RZN0_9SOLA|nr:hypothetical protein RND71_022055 [Anisodus tanguticus]
MFRQRTVCLTCGDEGDTKLFIYCLKCRDSAVHHYFLEKFSPDDDNIDWICWDCAPKVAKVEQFRKSERISVRKIRAFDVRVRSVQSATTHNPFQVLQKEKPSFTETKKQEDIGEACVDVCYSEQKIESVKAGNTLLVGKHPKDLAQSRGKSSMQDPKSPQSLTEIAKQQEMRKPRRRFVVLDDDSDFEREGGASGGKFNSLSPDEHYVPLNNLYSEPEIEFVVLDDDSDFEGEGGASGGKFASLSPDEHHVPVNNLNSEPQIESADYMPAQALIDPIWRENINFHGFR